MLQYFMKKRNKSSVERKIYMSLKDFEKKEKKNGKLNIKETQKNLINKLVI